MTEPNDQAVATPREHELSRLYRAAADEVPPAALDAAILKAARDAVTAPAAPLMPWWKRLLVPAGVAATALFAVMLSLTMERNSSQGPEVAIPKAAPAAATVPSPAAAPAASNARNDRAGTVGNVGQSPASPAEKKMKAAESQPPVRDLAVPQVLPAPPAAPASAEGRLAAPAARAEQPAGGEAAALDRAPAALAAPARESAAKRAAPRAEVVWLEEVRQLRRQGRHEEAARRLAEFRAAYPDYVLPDDMK